MTRNLKEMPINIGIEDAKRYKTTTERFYTRAYCIDCKKRYEWDDDELPFRGHCSNCRRLIQVEWYFDYRTQKTVNVGKVLPENPNSPVGEIIWMKTSTST